MPSPKAILRDIAEFDLDPSKNYTKSHLNKLGRVKPHSDLVEEIKVEPAAEKSVPKEFADKKPTLKTESPAKKKLATGSSSVKAKSTERVASESAKLEGTSSVEINVEQGESKVVAEQIANEIVSIDADLT
jgi:hypothetical protein